MRNLRSKVSELECTPAGTDPFGQLIPSFSQSKWLILEATLHKGHWGELLRTNGADKVRYPKLGGFKSSLRLEVRTSFHYISRWIAQKML
jgi:hypothetical protein